MSAQGAAGSRDARGAAVSGAGGRARARPPRNEIARRLALLKRAVLALALAGFAALSGLAASHRTGVSARVGSTGASAPIAAAAGFFAQDGSAGLAEPTSSRSEIVASSGAS